MNQNRREFLRNAAFGMGGLGALLAGTRAWGGTVPPFGVCDWSIDGSLKPEALATAKAIGLDGIEISAGTPRDVLEIADPALQEKYKAAMAETGLTICSVAMGLLNQAPLATDPRGPAWLEQTIDGAKALGAKTILMAFFGDGDLLDKNDKLKMDMVDAAAARIKAAAPRAKDAGITLAVENTLSGRDNLLLLEKIGDPSVRVYYDVGNSTYHDYDVTAEIRELKDRICQIHFKDGKHYLGKGEVDLAACVKAIQDINYAGWIVLETSKPSGDIVADFKTNLAYSKKLFSA